MAGLGHLGGTKMTSNPFLHLKCTQHKMEHAGGEAGETGEHGALEMQTHAAARSQVLLAPGARIT